MAKLKNFYDKLLTHLKKENYLTDEDVKKIKQDPYYLRDVAETVQLMVMTTPNLTNVEKICYKAANFCEKIGLPSLSKHLMHKITPEKLAKIDDTEKVVAESLKIKEILLEPIVKPVAVKPISVKPTPTARMDKAR